MPTAHTRFSYTFAELTDSAQAKAVEAVAEKLGGDWFDESDNDTIREDIVWELGRTLKAPGWDIEGAGDFRGIAGVTLDGWDLGQGDHLALKGTLDRDNAPALPWADGVGDVTLTTSRYGTTIEVEQADLYFTCATCGKDAVWETSGYHEGDMHHVIVVPGGTANDDLADDDHKPVRPSDLADREALCREVKAAVSDALTAGLRAGRDALDYVGSEDNARNYIEGNDPAFNEDGSLF